MPVEAVATAIKSGDLSFSFFDAAYWDRFSGWSATTFRGLSAETGLGFELLQAIRESAGYARPSLDDRVREDEMDAIALVQAVMAAGADPVAMERQVRAWGDNLRRIAEAESAFYNTQIQMPMLRSGLTHSEMLNAGGEVSASIAPLLDPALLAMYHAHSEHTWMAGVVEAVEATLERAGLHRTDGRPPAMCFLDLTGYTRLTEERGDEAAAEVSAILGGLTQQRSHAHGGRPVKWLGDGVMVYFKEPTAAVMFALEMRDDIPSADLPPAHVGIAAGPLIFQDGDYFGRTVNVAARIATHASAGQVLVSDDVVQVAMDPRLAFVDVGSVELSGVSEPMRLHEARRS